MSATCRNAPGLCACLAAFGMASAQAIELPATCSTSPLPIDEQTPMVELRKRVETLSEQDPTAVVQLLCATIPRVARENGEESVELAWWVGSLATPLIAYFDKFAEAIPLLQKAQGIFERELGRDAPELADIHVAYAWIKWFGSRDRLIGEVLVKAAEPILDDARATAKGRGGPALLDAFDRVNRAFAGAPALRQFVEQERGALRIATSGSGVVQPYMVARIRSWIEEEVEAGRYEPPVDPATLAYAIVRLAEAFLYNDAGPEVRGDVDRLREVEAALLGVSL